MIIKCEYENNAIYENFSVKLYFQLYFNSPNQKNLTLQLSLW